MGKRDISDKRDLRGNRFLHIPSQMPLMSLWSLMSLLPLILGLFSIPNLKADPWGKDADLVSGCNQVSCCQKNCSTPFLGSFAEVMIKFHQNVISPADGPRSNFIPSSSQYTLDAMRKYGFFQGFSMGCDRLMRENQDPWVYRITINGAGHSIKYDPVP